MSEKTADMVFESSWEVCNKCGGIYTVITSKVPLMQAHYDTYILIGPLFDHLPQDFSRREVPAPFARAFSYLASQGIRCEYGEWDTEGRPTTILIDARKLFSYLNDIKADLWRRYGIDSLHAAYDFDEPLAWSWGVGMFLEQIGKQFADKKIIGHFHEWLSGFSSLYLKEVQSSIATVFTTHATMLGRTISSRGIHLLSVLDSMDAEEQARRYGVIDKFSTERACALNSDVFSTVSATTAMEAEKLFGRQPDILPNGLFIDKFPTFDEATISHRKNKEKLNRFTMSHFFPYQSFDLSTTRYFYTSGRYEYINKGLDLTIDALAKLNEELKARGSKTTVVMFFFMAMHSDGPKRELLENKSYVQGLSSRVRERSEYFLQRVVLNVMLAGRLEIEILPPDYLEDLRREFHFVRRQGNPPLCTHQLLGEEDNDVLKHLRRAGLLNRAEDKVKVVFVPAYLTGADGLFNMEYYEVVSGCHFGIFPSNYEPWGYTPLESIAFGVPAITSSISGFGQHMKDKIVGDPKGLFVIDADMSRENMVDELYGLFNLFVSYDRQARVHCKMKAHALSTFADWRQLVHHYIQAHNKALRIKASTST